MKLDEVELTEDSPQEEVSQPKEEENKNEETQPMLDYDNIKSSQDIEVPPLLIDQVIGHEESIETIKKAAKQRRNVLLIGDPGVGKSMLAKGMAQILPHETLKDILVYPNMEDNNHPLIRTVPAGEGKKIVKATKGHGTEVFKKTKGLFKSAPKAELCFSIIGAKDKSINVECDSEAEVDHWVKSVELIAEYMKKTLS